MGSAWSWLVLLSACAGWTGEPSDHVSYRVRILEMPTLFWRAEFHSRLTPLERKNGITVWSVAKDAAPEIAEQAAFLLAEPRMLQVAGEPAHFTYERQRSVVADVKRVADGPTNKATALAFQPEVGTISEGFQIDLKGVRTDQGWRTRVAISDRRLDSIETVTISESVVPKKTGDEPTALAVGFQVPVVSSSKVEGEWMIANGSALVISMGPFHHPGGGRTAVHERIAIIEAKSTATLDAHAQTTAHRSTPPSLPNHASQPRNHALPSIAAPEPPAPIGVSPLSARQMRAPARSTVTINEVAGAPARLSPSWLQSLMIVPRPIAPPAIIVVPKPEILAARSTRMPAALPPSHAMPTPVTADGVVVPLPTLPEDAAHDAITASGETRPAPQTRQSGPPSKDAPRGPHTNLASATGPMQPATLRATSPSGPITIQMGDVRATCNELQIDGVSLPAGGPSRLILKGEVTLLNGAMSLNCDVLQLEASTKPPERAAPPADRKVHPTSGAMPPLPPSPPMHAPAPAPAGGSCCSGGEHGASANAHPTDAIMLMKNLVIQPNPAPLSRIAEFPKPLEQVIKHARGVFEVGRELETESPPPPTSPDDMTTKLAQSASDAICSVLRERAETGSSPPPSSIQLIVDGVRVWDVALSPNANASSLKTPPPSAALFDEVVTKAGVDATKLLGPILPALAAGLRGEGAAALAPVFSRDVQVHIPIFGETGIDVPLKLFWSKPVTFKIPLGASTLEIRAEIDHP